MHRTPFSTPRAGRCRCGGHRCHATRYAPPFNISSWTTCNFTIILFFVYLKYTSLAYLERTCKVYIRRPFRLSPSDLARRCESNSTLSRHTSGPPLEVLEAVLLILNTHRHIETRDLAYQYRLYPSTPAWVGMGMLHRSFELDHLQLYHAILLHLEYLR